VLSAILASETSINLLAARYQMALSLGFHIVLSCFGVAFPAIIFIAHWRGIYRNDADALVLAKRWSKVAAVLFAVGAVSGTILSFEMGLLWPGLMGPYGDVIGLPFALEGIAFFTEAVFLGIYRFGWGRLAPRTHLLTLLPIMAAGLFGTFCIIAVNAWMNAPAGFDLVDGVVTNVDPMAAMFNRAVLGQFVHMWVAAFMVTGFLVASAYAVGMLRGRRDRLHRLGFRIPFAVATVFALVQPFVGHVIGLRLATEQPTKLAAMELAVETEARAPLIIGGVLVDGEVRGGIEIPDLGSLIARGGVDREVPGLNDVPPEDRPPANIVHWSFQTMIAMGMALMAIGAGYWLASWRGRDLLRSRWFLRIAALTGVMAVVALETGWITTEVGRQPWMVNQVLRVADSVTPNNGVVISLAVLVIVYTAMGIAAVRVLLSMTRRWRDGGADLATPYGPPDRVPVGVGASPGAAVPPDGAGPQVGAGGPDGPGGDDAP
jgi:cytochrome d ubiquinol oxidase subunit I